MLRRFTAPVRLAADKRIEPNESLVSEADADASYTRLPADEGVET